MKKKLALFAALFAVVTLAAVFGWATSTKAAADCDTNALIYCGVSSVSNLKYKLDHGTGREYQSSSELKALYAKYNINEADFGSLKTGKVTKDNKVYVGNKVVASNVYTMGRHNIQPGSTKISGLSYPVYQRHPSVSFLSSNISAYVYLNYDGTMRYAIIKSCGNIVIGVVHTPAKPPVVVTKATLVVTKFQDDNGNGVLDSGENLLGGWQFRVTGPGFNQTVTTLDDGTVTLTGLTPGIYTVTEVLQSGWTNTTGISIAKNVTTDPDSQEFIFGNKQNTTPPVVIPTGGGETTVLPATGTADWVLGGLVLVLLGAGLWWVRSKDMLRHARRRKPTGAVKKTVKPRRKAGKRK